VHDLAAALSPVTSVEFDDDGALTVRHGGTVASLRKVDLAEGLAMISLTQVLAWDLDLDAQLRKTVAAHTNTTMLGTVVLIERPGHTADVMLRYNFPFGGLEDGALRTLVLLVLEAGVAVRAALTV
jgi:hypothetical protein